MLVAVEFTRKSDGSDGCGQESQCCDDESHVVLIEEAEAEQGRIREVALFELALDMSCRSNGDGLAWIDGRKVNFQARSTLMAGAARATGSSALLLARLITGSDCLIFSTGSARGRGEFAIFESELINSLASGLDEARGWSLGGRESLDDANDLSQEEHGDS